MGSAGKKKTTMAKLNRETKLRDKRAQKQARKAARKLTAADDAEVVTDGDEDLSALDRFDASLLADDAPSSDAAEPDVAGAVSRSES